MYTKFQLAKKWLYYYFTASNGNGHGIHSPFVFNFITAVLKDKKQYPCYAVIEKVRAALKTNNAIIEVEDFGAGSNSIKSNRRAVKAIAKSSLKPVKYAQLLHRMVQYYAPQNVVELGTSLGITTAYLATADAHTKVFTCEGAGNVAAIAENNFKQLRLENITIVPGDFSKTLPTLFSSLKNIDFAFVDGNHLEIPTLLYFEQLLACSNDHTILVFDDIHWSREMEAAWSVIQQHAAVTLTIDLFFIGIVCINTSIKEKQHFTIAY